MMDHKMKGLEVLNPLSIARVELMLALDEFKGSRSKYNMNSNPTK